MLLTKSELGALAERHAVQMLTNKGHTILAQNFRTKFGEIDIITKKNATLYLHEVKVSRSSNSYPFYNWNLIQKRRMIKAFCTFFKHEANYSSLEIKICFIWFAFINPNRLKLILFNQDIEIDS